VISDRSQKPARVFTRILAEIPAGWQDPDATGARIEYLGRSYAGPRFDPAGCVMSEPISLWTGEIGRVLVSRGGERSADCGDAFLPEESELLRRIASRLGEYLEWKHTELLGEGVSAGAMHWACPRAPACRRN